MRDRIVVVTGSSEGIGKATAVALHHAGAKPVLVARRGERLADVAAQCGGAMTHVADMTRRADVERVVAATIAHHGSIDVWINNVGRGITRNPSELTDDDLDEMIRVNVKSAWYGVQAVLPHFRARGKGQIINVSSMLGRVPFAMPRAAYSASKSALNSLTACLRAELAATHPNIGVSLFSPGAVATEFGKNALHGGIDSRKLPNSQTAEEVAAELVRLVAQPRSDAYSRPEFKNVVVEYYSKLE
jgi:NAD(P)-dependent dehydrogenase (short-subunit alcohol dehydrogenase family)